MHQNGANNQWVSNYGAISDCQIAMKPHMSLIINKKYIWHKHC